MTSNSRRTSTGELRDADNSAATAAGARWAGYHDGQHSRPYPAEYEQLPYAYQTTYEAARCLGVVIRRDLGLRPWPFEWTFAEFVASLKLSDEEADVLDTDICETFFSESRDRAVAAWQRAQLSLRR